MYEFRQDESNADLAPVAADALERLLDCERDDPELRVLRQYDHDSIFGFLEHHREVIGASRLVRLQWAYLPALGHEPSVSTLQTALASVASVGPKCHTT
jgi:hypothetical protein